MVCFNQKVDNLPSNLKFLTFDRYASFNQKTDKLKATLRMVDDEYE